MKQKKSNFVFKIVEKTTDSFCTKVLIKNGINVKFQVEGEKQWKKCVLDIML